MGVSRASDSPSGHSHCVSEHLLGLKSFCKGNKLALAVPGIFCFYWAEHTCAQGGKDPAWMCLRPGAAIYRSYTVAVKMFRLHPSSTCFLLYYIFSMTVFSWFSYLQKMLEKLRAKKTGKTPWLAEAFECSPLLDRYTSKEQVLVRSSFNTVSM